MKINQVCQELGITKKAISYYEKQGLIKIDRDDKGYRLFTSADICLLKEITLYRKLQMSTSDIREILVSDSKKSLLEIQEQKNNLMMRQHLKQQDYLKKLIHSKLDETSIEEILSEMKRVEDNDKTFVMKKFTEAFPGGLGVILSIHFSNFTFDKIKTTEQNTAWMNMITFLDENEQLQISDKMMTMLEGLENESVRLIHSQMKEDVLKDNLDDEMILEMMNQRNDMYEVLEKELPDFYEDYMAFQDQLKVFFSSDEYRVNVLDNMKLLSKEYCDYHKRLTDINQDYDHNL